MSRRVATLHDAMWPKAPEFDVIATAWPENVVIKMLTLVWEGFDRMKAQHLRGVDFSQPIHQLERGLTDLHAREITLAWNARRSGFESFLPKHEAWEFSRVSSPSAMPPSYDIGFEHMSDPRLRWPVEAKVMNDGHDVGRYLRDLRDKYLVGKGAPFSGSAALLGYLRTGAEGDAFQAIESSLNQTLVVWEPFSTKTQRVSQHRRRLRSASGPMHRDFRCHHLIAALTT